MAKNNNQLDENMFGYDLALLNIKQDLDNFCQFFNDLGGNMIRVLKYKSKKEIFV